jgi:hypothetical protein
MKNIAQIIVHFFLNICIYIERERDSLNNSILLLETGLLKFPINQFVIFFLSNPLNNTD